MLATGGLLIRIQLVGLLFVMAVLGPCFASAQSKDCTLQTSDRIVAADMWKIGTALEHYDEKHGAYPTSRRRLVPVAEISSMLAPHATDVLPTAGPHGRYLYWSSGETYFILSRGADETEDVSYSRLMNDRDLREFDTLICHGRVEDPRQDIIFTQGQFCQWRCEYILAK